MKKIMILILIALGVVMFYRAFKGGREELARSKKPSPKGVVRDVMEQGRRTGRGAGRAFDSVNFGERKR